MKYVISVILGTIFALDFLILGHVGKASAHREFYGRHLSVAKQGLAD